MTVGSQAQYARHRNVSKQSVTRWKREGRLVLEDGLIDFEATDKALADSGHASPWSVTPVTDYDDPEPPEGIAAHRVYDLGKAPHSKAEAERIKENYLALLRELEFETKSGRLVDAAEVEKSVFEIARAERDALMNWPQRIAAELAAEFGIDAVKLAVELEKHVRQYLEERSQLKKIEVLE